MMYRTGTNPASGSDLAPCTNHSTGNTTIIDRNNSDVAAAATASFSATTRAAKSVATRIPMPMSTHHDSTHGGKTNTFDDSSSTSAVRTQDANDMLPPTSTTAAAAAATNAYSDSRTLLPTHPTQPAALPSRKKQQQQEQSTSLPLSCPRTERDLKIFDELLDAEVAVDMPNLREASRMGVPPLLRSVVYRYLLGVTLNDESSHMSVERVQEMDFEALVASYHALWPWKPDRSKNAGGGAAGSAGAVGAGGNSGGSNSSSSAADKNRRAAAGTALFLLSDESADGVDRSAAVSHVLYGNPDYLTARLNGLEKGRYTIPLTGLAQRLPSNEAWARARLHVQSSISSSASVASAKAVTAAAAAAAASSSSSSLAAVSAAVSSGARRVGERRQSLERVLGALQVIHAHVPAPHVQCLLLLAMSFDRLPGIVTRDTFFCVQSVYYTLTHFQNILHNDASMRAHCGTFLMLFRAVNAPLYHHFFCEGLTTLQWVPELLVSLLAGRLHREDLYALWDFYFAGASDQHRNFALHPYVCLAILYELTERLIDSDQTEILHVLHHLPRINTAVILHKAISMRELVLEQGLVSSREGNVS